MSENSFAIHKSVRIGLLGAAFDTGNMGVSALAESAIKCILHRWPNAQLTLLDSGKKPGEHFLKINDKDIHIETLPVRFCKNIFLENHFLVLCFYAILFKLFSWERFKRFCARRNASLNSIIQMDMVADITGGDSFSDIYGMRRFTLGFLRKWLVLLFNKDLVMLPQTYGPFKGRVARTMARHILNRASLVYSRDRAGVEYVNSLLGNCGNRKARFAPDVAFILDSRKPDNFDDALLLKAKGVNNTLVGLNISGLLFNGGYTKDNMFGLKTDYRELVLKIIDFFMKDEKNIIILIPHVFPPAGWEVESDPEACRMTYELTKDTYKERILLANGKYNHNEIKYIIGLCDFFIGSRMHTCIAAISQNIPTVGLAYSKKFEGVFESIGLGDCVADIRNCDEEEVLEKLESVFKRRNQIRNQLEHVIPQVKENILGIFNN